MTVRTALASARRRLAAVSDAPRLDAERLLLHALGRREASWLHAHGEEELADPAAENMASLVQRRQAGEPLAYILGEWEFYGRPFYVTPDVLVPRPATEALIDAALAYIAAQNRPLVIADIGTGSGCVAVTVVLESRIKNLELSVIATDISPAALAVARRNAERHDVLDQIEFLGGDLLAPLSSHQIDLIVSNPPYVPSQELANAGRSPETIGLNFEPRIALDGGADGQDYIRQLAAAGVPAIVEGAGGRIQSFNLA